MYIVILGTKEKGRKKVNNKSGKPSMFDVVPSQEKTFVFLFY